jgi:[ribosomal protein S18]-alanine N-acetyltransferase
VAEDGLEIKGFIVARHVGSEIEILNFAVPPQARRQGFGAALLGKALEWGRTIHSRRAILEVRESNLEALRFYERHNFQVTGRRLRYYTSPIEDALVLAAPLT